MNYASPADPAGRTYDFVDRLILGIDRALAGGPSGPAARRTYPAAGLPEAALAPRERRLSQALLRVDHAGEVAAQALYEAQGLTARSPAIGRAMRQAAVEELDHLAWCRQRIAELDGRTSLLGPFWYAGSFAIGVAAGLAGDRWSLGFVAETERQVVRHLDSHLARLPAADARSRAVLARMREDEARHGTAALDHGGAELPGPIRGLMRLCARIMTGTAFWL